MARSIVILALLFPLLEAAAETLDAAALEATTARAEQGEAEAQYALGEHYRFQGDDYTAYHWFVKAAEQGLVEAQFMASRLAHQGVDWSDDPADHPEQGRLAKEESIRWLRLAAEGGLVVAQTEYARAFQYGNDVPRDLEEALRWYRKAAEQESREAQFEIAQIYHGGIDVEQDYKEALRWYRIAGSANQIGHFYEHGLSVEQDYAEALRWYRKAAGLDPDGSHPAGMSLEDAIRKGTPGSRTAMRSLARFHEHGWAEPAKPELALRIYRALAGVNDRESMRQLARMYHDGIIVPRDARKSAEWAFRSLRGDDASMFDILGFMISPLYHSEDTAKLMGKTFELAAADGEAWAQWFLAGHYLHGRGGVDPDMDAALRLLEAAAEQGHPVAAFVLGQRYLEGDGVEQDDERAAQLFQKALETVAIRRTSGRMQPTDFLEFSDRWDFVAAYHWFRDHGAPQGDIFSMHGLVMLHGFFAARDFADPVELYKWAFIAAERGFPLHEHAAEPFKGLELPEAAEEGRRRAEAWLEANPE